MAVTLPAVAVTLEESIALETQTHTPKLFRGATAFSNDTLLQGNKEIRDQ